MRLPKVDDEVGALVGGRRLAFVRYNQGASLDGSQMTGVSRRVCSIAARFARFEAAFPALVFYQKLVELRRRQPVERLERKKKKMNE